MRKVKLTVPPKGKDLFILDKVETILAENQTLLQSLSDRKVEDFIHRILKARAIFFSAQGRSGFILRCFCMRRWYAV